MLISFKDPAKRVVIVKLSLDAILGHLVYSHVLKEGGKTPSKVSLAQTKLLLMPCAFLYACCLCLSINDSLVRKYEVQVTDGCLVLKFF